VHNNRFAPDVKCPGTPLVFLFCLSCPWLICQIIEIHPVILLLQQDRTLVNTPPVLPLSFISVEQVKGTGPGFYILLPDFIVLIF